MVRTGAEIIIECLKEQGVDVVFGYPGGSILNVYDALYKHSDEIFHVLTSHEQGAAHAADGYARATGKVGVCMATSGPGATNLVTGIATASQSISAADRLSTPATPERALKFQTYPIGHLTPSDGCCRKKGLFCGSVIQSQSE